MTTFIRVFILIILSITLISCGSFSDGSQQQVKSTQTPTPSSTPKPLATTTITPSASPTTSITPSPTNVPVCVASTSSIDGWDCLNQSYGFRVHFPSTVGNPPLHLTDTVMVWLENSPSNPRVERRLSIALGKTAESCISPDLKTKQIGELNFIVNHGYEPSGVVYEWRSYAITNDSKSVCFWFTAGFQIWEQNDPLFPPEKDQGLDEVESILATFQWLSP